MNAITAKAGFIDNLIPLKKGLFGEQTAGWQPGAPSMQGLGCQIIADQMIPMADGISLCGDIYLPKKPGRYPAILVFGAYTKELHAAGIPAGTNEVGSPPVFTDRGYAHVIVTRRGMGRSGGKTGLFFNDQDVDDHEAIIAWVAAQPWCDGQVVLMASRISAAPSRKLRCDARQRSKPSLATRCAPTIFVTSPPLAAPRVCTSSICGRAPTSRKA